MSQYSERYIKFSSAFLILIFVAGLVAGGIISCYITAQQVNILKNEVSSLRNQVSKLWGFQNVTYENITIYQNSTALSELYERVKESVVLIRAILSDGSAQGSGFVYNFSNTMVIITNYHVIHGAINVSVTFSNGNGYSANVIGKDPYSDLAVLLVEAPENEFKPLEVVSSSTLRVGDPVIAIGNPYGLVGSMTTGIISALGRTITEEYTGNFAIANVIQTSTPINPGNSGGPLLNYCGKVIGVTTAIIAESQGLGFAIPSNTILREMASLIENGTYDGHSYLGVIGMSMDYETAQKIGIAVTYGWLVVEVLRDGPSYGKLKVNDLIVALNGTRIRNGDDLASYLEENTLPGNTVVLTVYRQAEAAWTEMQISVVLGQRPPPPV
ncbi:MAG: trypsin-like peptidase domain-containing protein [Candidatus Bathyarchaeia archaeon]